MVWPQAGSNFKDQAVLADGGGFTKRLSRVLAPARRYADARWALRDALRTREMSQS
jgi:hypothetical protein